VLTYQTLVLSIILQEKKLAARVLLDVDVIFDVLAWL
jgi:hypothetical protein